MSVTKLIEILLAPTELETWDIGHRSDDILVQHSLNIDSEDIPRKSRERNTKDDLQILSIIN